MYNIQSSLYNSLQKNYYNRYNIFAKQIMFFFYIFFYNHLRFLNNLQLLKNFIKKFHNIQIQAKNGACISYTIICY